MYNPFEQIAGRRNARAGNAANPFMNRQQGSRMGMQQAPQAGMQQAPQTGMQQAPNVGMKQAPQAGMQQAPQAGMQNAGDRFGQTRNPFDQVAAGDRSAGNTGRFSSPDPRGGNEPVQGGNPFMYDPNQRSQQHYAQGFWPNTGEMTLLLQGIDPWGGQYDSGQQQWLQQVGPYVGVPQMQSQYSGPTELSRDFTAVNLADQAGGDPQQAFRDAWLGRSKQAPAQNAYNTRLDRNVSGATANAHGQWSHWGGG